MTEVEFMRDALQQIAETLNRHHKAGLFMPAITNTDEDAWRRLRDDIIRVVQYDLATKRY